MDSLFFSLSLSISVLKTVQNFRFFLSFASHPLPSFPLFLSLSPSLSLLRHIFLSFFISTLDRCLSPSSTRGILYTSFLVFHPILFLSEGGWCGWDWNFFHSLYLFCSKAFLPIVLSSSFSFTSGSRQEKMSNSPGKYRTEQNSSCPKSELHTNLSLSLEHNKSSIPSPYFE